MARAHSGRRPAAGGTVRRRDGDAAGVRPGADRAGDPPPAGEVWLYGRHPVRAALENSRRVLLEACFASGAEDELAPLCRARGLPPRQLDRPALDRLFPPETPHQGVALRVRTLRGPALEEIIPPADQPALVLMLDQVTDPRNAGAILRAAAIFGACGVVVQDRGAPPETAALAKSASGALEHVPLVRVTNLSRALEQLARCGFWRIGLDAAGSHGLAEGLPGGRLVLVLGAEGSGLRRLVRDKCDLLARIPLAETAAARAIGSLNVATAASIALYEARRALTEAGASAREG